MERLSSSYRIHILHVYYILIAASPRAHPVSGSNSGSRLSSIIMGNTLYHMKFKDFFIKNKLTVEILTKAFQILF
jgi:hypothetical protein